VTDVTARLEEIDSHILRLDTLLRGNGSRGLFTEFELLKSRVAQLEEFHRDLKRTKAWAATTGVTVVGHVMWQVLIQYRG